MIAYQYFPKTRNIPAHLQHIINCFEMNYDLITSDKNQLKSNDVLAILSDTLTHEGFKAEPQDGKIKVPVLFGRNGNIEKSFDADAYNEELHTVIEIEAGRGYTNNQFLKDLFQACMMHELQYLVIAVRKRYLKTPDFEKVFQFFDTLYQSERLKLPLTGILLVGY
ncbi:hypothetical protein SDC9_142556 [bioreactor metagenome]|uniref:Uncharacterized protein n=1 Tax=bioreactor metagenome TaxID=1076179 RepID=A0A645E4A5_9ZZZZ